MRYVRRTQKGLENKKTKPIKTPKCIIEVSQNVVTDNDLGDENGDILRQNATKKEVYILMDLEFF